MAAVNPNALGKFTGILEIAPQATPGALRRVASVRGMVANLDNTVNQVEINADDTGTVFKGNRPEGRFEGTFLEIFDRDLIQLLFGGTPSDVAGSAVNNFQQVIGVGWAYSQFNKLSGQNANGTAPNIDSVVGSVDGALVANDDYLLTKDINGNWGITILDSATVSTLNQTITVQYDYTPNASEVLVVPMTFQESPRLYCKITAEDDNGKERVIILDDATFEGVYGMEFLDPVEAGDLKGATFNFKTAKGSNLRFENEIL